MFFDCDDKGHLINVYTCLDKELNPIDCPSTLQVQEKHVNKVYM